MKDLETGIPLSLEMPGNHRYQPKSMQEFFGYDNSAGYQIEAEWALLESLADIEIIPPEEAILLTEGLKEYLLRNITTSKQDDYEKRVTKHNIRALVHLMQENMPGRFEPLRKWVHFTATSYDIIETARIIAFKEAFRKATFPALLSFIKILSDKAEEFASERQIGRTHGQHALPITVGFWLATVLDRIVDSAEGIYSAEQGLVAKFSGAVGAYNAQSVFSLDQKAQELFKTTFEDMVLSKLGLRSGTISTQILSPNPLARFLFEYNLLSAAFGQLERDCRHLQRTEIGEVREEFGAMQVGSSTMAQNRNPISFESAEDQWPMVRISFLGVLDCLVSDHQRILVESYEARNFPAIVVLCQEQIERMNRTFPKITIDRSALSRNFGLSEKLIMAEPIYLALQLYGYKGDAHNFVNHTLVPRASESGNDLMTEFIIISSENKEIEEVLSRIPEEIQNALCEPQNCIGKAETKTMEVVEKARAFLAMHKSN